jgi:FMN phosphatase YigB (HAD superfamily)
MIKLIAFDLDGTLTQHKTKLSDEHRAVLEKLKEKYTLVMAGAGQCRQYISVVRYQRFFSPADRSERRADFKRQIELDPGERRPRNNNKTFAE